jgi:hypothetical protein
MRLLEQARASARKALDSRTRAIEPDEPFAGVVLGARRGESLAANPSRLLQHWASQSIGSEVSPLRYPWLLSHERFVKPPAYAGAPETWRAWHASEQSMVNEHPFRVESRLSTPLILAHNCEILLETVDRAPQSQALLGSVLPRARRDFAAYVQATDPWADTFALWCLVQQPRLSAKFRPIAIALALSYTESALLHSGPVQGTRFPFRGVSLCSATAHLAQALLQLGLDLALVARQVAFLQGCQRVDGGWGDGDDPSDPLTTLVVAELLAAVDPGFDRDPVIDYFLNAQGADGWWTALGPERPWLTARILRLLSWLEEPFAQRFRWAPCDPSEIDSKTGLPRYAYFLSLGDMLSHLPGLSEASLEVGFLDLAGFKKFNDTFGQDQGDKVLKLLAEQLSQADGIWPVRDGGDEYLLLGAPTSEGLRERLDIWRQTWPDVFRRTFGQQTPVVSPRILVTRRKGRDLLAGREALGRGITSLKSAIPGPEGILESLDSL